MPRFIVRSASAWMPASCEFGNYARVGVLELNDGFTAKDVTMISDRARAVKRVVETWERLNVGKTERCAYRRALRDATDLCDALNTGVES